MHSAYVVLYLLRVSTRQVSCSMSLVPAYFALPPSLVRVLFSQQLPRGATLATTSKMVRCTLPRSCTSSGVRMEETFVPCLYGRFFLHVFRPFWMCLVTIGVFARYGELCLIFSESKCCFKGRAIVLSSRSLARFDPCNLRKL